MVSNTSVLSNIGNAPKRRGRPLKIWKAISPDPAVSTLEPSGIESTLQKREQVDHPCHPLNVEDMQLFYHFVTNTSLTLGDDVLWRDKVPVLAFERPYVLRLILALSAIHLTRLPDVQPTEVARYERLGEDHLSMALREVTDLLPTINSQNCSALYISTVLICDVIFAKPPTADHLLVVANDSQVAWWTLFRGVRFVIERSSLDAIFSNHLGPLRHKDTTSLPSSRDQSGYIPWEEHLTNLTSLITLTCTHNEKEMNLLEVLRQGLVDCFREVYGTLENQEAITNGKTHVVIRWLWIIDDEFIDQIKRDHPAALVLLAHFTVILQTLECYWFMKGWAVHVMNGIVERLESTYQGWIFWPRTQTGV